MKRICLPNQGPDTKNSQRAVALAIRECEALKVKEFTLVVAAKNNFESTVIGQFLGRSAKKLVKGDLVPVDTAGNKVRLESVATMVKEHSAKVVLALHLTPADIQKLDDLWIDTLIYVPFNEADGQAWASKWDIETFGVQKVDHPINLPEEVVEALQGLTASINLSTGLGHPSDKRDAKLTFEKLRDAGVRWEPSELEKWAVRNKWRADHAQNLSELSARYL